MSARYQLPCVCGQSTPVDMRQAGEVIACGSCGGPLEVPTMRALRGLAADPSSTAIAAGPAWGRRQGLIFLGLVIAAASLALYGIFYLRLPEAPTFQVSRDRLDALTLVQAFEVWSVYVQGMPNDSLPEIEMYRRNLAAAERQMNVALAGVVVGLLVAAGSLFVPRAGAARL